MAADRTTEYKESEFKETHEPNMSILIHCRTVVEKKDYVSTGILTYAEGDMVEVEIGDYQLFSLGSIVKLTIYTPAGIFMFNTTVIAKDDGYLILINPPENRRKFSEKRKETRVDIDRKGFIKGTWSDASTEKKEFAAPLEVSVNNISQSGMRFTMGGDLKLYIGEYIEFTADLGTMLSCKAQIVRMEESGSGTQYGVEIIDIPAEMNKALRAYILKSQVVYRSTLKKTTDQKRVFK
jgi:c-di-GMP-binding flagellar brake protein YcgR